MDKKWKELFKNPPLNWRDAWKDRKKISRFDSKEQALKFKEKIKSDYKNEILLDIHPKDGYVLYQEENEI
ncbi:MAG: hypothetical protein IJ880_04730 [Bacilli bacterium]|nr:hypothetical protein [Bacilli bacterium]MBR3119727.1 hypothetical protein [Oceanobacillus sp.]